MNLLEMAKQLSESSLLWASESVDSFNGNQVEVRVMRQSMAKWHVHPHTDEMFMVLSGSVTIDTEKGSFDLKANDCLVVKAGMQHRARTASTATLMTLINPTA